MASISFFLFDFQSVLVIDFLEEQRTVNAAYYSKLLKDREKSQPFVQNDEVDQSKASVSTTRRVRTPPL
jgi:hypothetical protein